ncbi:lysosomal alpha-mannosidase [Bicyclus anynana]|uniref:Lysosomal alpha-mannosidase n=1 Tax=Bicyclus anynana TaxID=110368 RepID=A0ABM3LJC8_BICAN|nr:lysosomal alpha-mannosidase [Bicyclus anynana]
MDAGWVKTFDEYYYGTKTSVSTANVQLIYHSVLSELLHDKRRTFTFSETAYFWRWWKEQRGPTRSTFRALVAEGRIQFAGGGWVQADEATSDYLQLLDLYTWGHRKLNDTLGPCGKPKAAWQIDTYGHSREHTSLLAQMGFDGLFIGRVDHKEREAMIEEDRMEFMWRGSDVLGKMSDIMSHTLFNLYNAPDGFCFDFLCSDEPIVDDPDSKVYNADKRVNDFVTQIERQAKYYDHDNILVTMGGDFTYQSAAHWFMNIDKLINHVNTHPANISDINIFYSTPSCYLKAIYLYGRRDKAVYTEKGDHLPYGSDANTYWTGFYTSRPSLKYFVKRAHVFLQIVKQLSVLSRAGDSYELHLFRHAVSLAFHHDALTGTSQQYVVNDFVKTISEAINACSKKVSQFLLNLTPTWGGSRRSKNSQQFVVCHQLNMSQCRFAEAQDSMLLVVYNPLSVMTYHHVRLPAVALQYTIRDFNDEEVVHQLVPLPTPVINLPGRSSSAIQELCFEAESIPPLGFTSYYIAPVRDQTAEGQFVKKFKQNPEAEQELPHISNEYIKVSVDRTTGLLESVQHVDGAKIMISQNYYYYSQGQQGAHSGAYSFRPERSRPTPVSDKASYHSIRGPLVKEIRQRFSDWVTQVIRLYRGEEFVELEWIIGPVPIGTDLGKEVVSIFKTNVSNHGVFYTDSNSRQMMKRTCWNESNGQQQKKPVSACYYPVTSRACLRARNASVHVCVLTDRAQGGTSYDEGEIELMVHRRLLTDDGFGLEESLNEEAFGLGLVVKGKHRIFFGNVKHDVEELTFSERATQMSRKWTFEPWLFMTSGEKISRRKWQNVRNKRYSALRLHGLPRHIHILTLEPWKAGSVLLRIENTLETTHGPQVKLDSESQDELSKSSHVTVDLRKLFIHFKIKKIRETTLAANQWLDDARQMDWSTRYVYSGGDDGIFPEDNPDYLEEMSHSQVTKSMDIRESAHYSEEDDYTKNKVYRHTDFNNKSQHKIKNTQIFENRNKRSANITENVIDQNGTNETKKVTTSNIKAEQTNNEISNENHTVNFQNSTLKPKIIESTTKFFQQQITTRKTPKLSFLTAKIKPSKLFNTDSAKSEEFISSDEYFPSTTKRRLSKKKSNMTKAFKDYDGTDLFLDDKDDGITKSMYDMYYKSFQSSPKQTAFKPHLRSTEETVERYVLENNRRVQEDSCETTSTRKRSKHKRRKGTIGMPFFMVDSAFDAEGAEVRNIDRESEPGKSRYLLATLLKRESVKGRDKIRKDYEDDAQEEDLLEEEMENEERSPSQRRKRSIMNDERTEQSSEPDPEHVITLRPTQIRTFVIWFYDKKPYNL